MPSAFIEERIPTRIRVSENEGTRWLRRELAMKTAREALVVFGQSDTEDLANAHATVVEVLAELVEAITHGGGR
ncbi:hypothetical protein OG413_45810 [Streptomyces sp. NBC_01433]|uniref:hypothetical protein n=1 Tax=Streptomyces sp. NBC_01433 TaxID=2903864 RepID=UPI002254E474|nr:hypothetical protein [Streptomyces sp. NBC_01433]MCX4682450.1 hypothetical protein [Streptomyces sp. NBC_01433]MCX4682503.1 hypothetical protein [Streptomyces sp. NBC_01433]